MSLEKYTEELFEGAKFVPWESGDERIPDGELRAYILSSRIQHDVDELVILADSFDRLKEVVERYVLPMEGYLPSFIEIIEKPLTEGLLHRFQYSE